MLTSVLKKLKHLISPKMSLCAKSRSEEISEQREESEEKMQNSECIMQNFHTEGEEVEAKGEAEEITETETDKTPAPAGNLSHLSSSVPRGASLPRGAMTKAEMREMRELLGNLDDAELHRLYKRVTQ